jgi:hypothetical protein
MKGQIVSCTTDGLVTDIKDLEERILNFDPKSFIIMYRSIRGDLSNDPTSLELKHDGEGVIS